ncbi:NlpC/P60 family protein [Streptomyces sp. NPDC046203]|uniref:NlpC/P60 family protein n=1 Tax=Streptomyces sp. NPDC046203 TaxID=3154602 RepID=UPI00340DEB61
MSTPKFQPSRRAALFALAGTAAGGALPLTAAPAAQAAQAAESAPASPAVPAALANPTAATTTTATGTATGTAGPQGPWTRLPMLADPTDPWHIAPHPAGALTPRTVPSGVEVSDDRGVLATLTTDARTVTLRGPRRWFTEQPKTVDDPFSRTLTSGWGQSPNGGTWTHHNGTATDYFVEQGRAAITLSPNQSRFSLLADRAIGDVYAAARFSFDRLPVGATASLALVFAAEDVNNHYRARLIVTPAGEVRLVLEKELENSVKELSAAVTVGTGFAAFDHWWVRVEKAGDLLRARAWKHGAGVEEPTTWHHSMSDQGEPPSYRVFRTGRVGVRGLASVGATVAPQARIYDFRVDSAVWTDAPLITHDTWVRVLPEPFDGAWTPAIEQRIRAWAGDTSPDALAYSCMYRPSFPDVTDPARPGTRVLGEAGYSPADPVTGLRTVGADFHEYMGRDWTFEASGETRSARPEFAGQLDCSGFVRMVYGHHMGLPMVRYQQFDGRNLPRESRHIAASGPGVKIAEGAAGQVPPLNGLRIGDTVFFDTDEDSDQGGHIGIYLGPDQHGQMRFVSSRKSPNGPTIGDIGGKSILNGTPKSPTVNGDLYTNTLRVIRRF